MKVIGIMVTVEAIVVGCSTISKAAMTRGMSLLVFFAYFRLLALLFLLPTCFFLYRKASIPLITRSTLLGLFLLAFLNYLGVGLTLIGLNYSSTTLYSAMGNLIPAFTFILAVLLRMETLNLKEKSSLFKCVGTVILIAGAFIIVFYQGLPITFSGTSSNSGKQNKLISMAPNWIIGGVFLLAGCFIAPFTLILKTWVSRAYPIEMMSTLIVCFFETGIALLVASFQVKDSSAWAISLDIKLVAIVSSGMLICGVLCPVQLWVCRKKGPVFSAMFAPLQMIFAVIFGRSRDFRGPVPLVTLHTLIYGPVFGVTTLGDTLHLGSVIGGGTIAAGFYTVMRGKAMEDTSLLVDEAVDQSPLLQNNKPDMPHLVFIN